ncbi:MAG TPA: outer membrane beta-barrel domain-containing protein [Polyangia bacterium]|jgi:outer membrane beta-barrel protein|nr:outer membrane beta-barrel domain-containing protein [Polyangia bacterium]
MKRPAVHFSAWLAVCLALLAITGWPNSAQAQRRKGRHPAAPATPPPQEKVPEQAPAAAPEAAPAADAPKEDTQAPPPAAADDLKLPEGDVTTPAATTTAASPTLSWQDIVVVPRKAFLKAIRLELAPFTGLSVNDLLIRHYVFGADLNFFLTDVLWIGLEGQYFIKSLTEREELTGLQYNRVPSLNRYLYGASFNLGYVPAYGKFTLFNRNILHWEIYANAGVGWTRTKSIPRDPAFSYQSFTNDDLTPNVGVGTRLFLFDWLTLNVSIRDYVFPDRLEKPSTSAPDPSLTPAQAKSAANQVFVNNVMVMAGVGIYLPTSFHYKSPR